MGEVIAFKLENNGAHMRPLPEGSAKIITFTGGWHAPMTDKKKNNTSGLPKVAWHEGCRSTFLYSLGRLASWGMAYLRGTCNGSGQAMPSAARAPGSIPGEAKFGGMSS
jgi:hypothetical protein